MTASNISSHNIAHMAWHDTSHHAISHNITWHDTTSDTTSHHITRHDNAWHDMTSRNQPHDIMPHHITDRYWHTTKTQPATIKHHYQHGTVVGWCTKQTWNYWYTILRGTQHGGNPRSECSSVGGRIGSGRSMLRSCHSNVRLRSIVELFIKMMFEGRLWINSRSIPPSLFGLAKLIYPHSRLLSGWYTYLYRFDQIRMGDRSGRWTPDWYACSSSGSCAQTFGATSLFDFASKSLWVPHIGKICSSRFCRTCW